MPSKLRVAVVGGGVCGMTCSVALLKEGVDTHVYEAGARLGEVEAGIPVVRILKAIGIWNDIVSRNRQPSIVRAHPAANPAAQVEAKVSHDGQQRRYFQFVSGMAGHEVLCDQDPGEPVAKGINRSVFLNALAHHVDPKRVHLRKQCTRITAAAHGAILHFQDGTTTTADIVLGADGIRSLVRRYVTDSLDANIDPHLKLSRTVCYRALIPVSKAFASGTTMDFTKQPVCFVGENKHITAYNVKAGTLVNVAAFASDPNSAADNCPPSNHDAVQEVSTSDVLEVFRSWGPEVVNLLSCAERFVKWNNDVVYPPIDPRKWVKGRVAILGDAAHGMLAHDGAGAGQGIEDAYLLAKLLGHPQATHNAADAILRTYAVVRQPRAQDVWEGSRCTGDILESRTEGFEVERLYEIWHYVWDRPTNADFEEANRILVGKNVFVKAAL
ncbi:uncharacterized protein PHACADRAFT_24951 [Phanerochaete carnosa HHB-10118-sp]|uniref:FAD-binding domain-containing protein n=1 Tax=Phanerochaete carnosa (strain HHB-10118-sp) TaxID=650164 RepID=K5WRF8_PHACS|nr:uncharacterized protein PHACADRAFT_24951 [Phanerochaete carnosa HHB-10118-sp]EKM61814.1 hypothetical protein PHACADRAFT_24951 [Phanerochaete carnosa HHB-10118-sp]